MIQNELLSAILNDQEKSTNNCGKKLILFSYENNPPEIILDDCPFRYFDDPRFDTITAITFSSSLKTAMQLVKKFKEINLYIGLPNDYQGIAESIKNTNDYTENKETAEEMLKIISEKDKKISIYMVDNSHTKIYFLSNSENPSLKRVILASANLSEIALKGNQIEHFTIYDGESKYNEIYNFFETKIKPNAKLTVDKKKIENEIIEYLKKEKVNLNLIMDKDDLKNLPSGIFINMDEETKKIIIEHALKNEAIETKLVEEVAKTLHTGQILNILQTPNIQNIVMNAEKGTEKVKEGLKNINELIKKRSLPKPKLKEEIYKQYYNILKKAENQQEEIFTTLYTYDTEKGKFTVKGLEDITYDLDAVKKDVEILNKFIEVYSAPNGEFEQERLWIVSTVLLYGFSSFYISFLRYVFQNKGQEVFLFEVAPVFCLLVGTANSGKTLLLSLLSKLFNKPIEKYGNIPKRSNSRSYIIEEYLTNSKEISPFLIDEVKPSDINDNKGFGESIKTYSNNPFGNSNKFIPQGNIFITANLEELNPENQITRRVLFFHFKASVKNSKEFKQRIISTGFNNLSDEIGRYYISWLNENIEYVIERLNEISSKENSNIKDTFEIAYKFLKSIGINVSMDFPDNFGDYEYFIRKFWKDWYTYYPEMFLDRGDGRIMVKKKDIYSYIKPSPYFNIEEASNTETYMFDKEKFLEFIDFNVKVDKKYIMPEEQEQPKKGIFSLIEKIFKRSRK